MHVFPRKAGLRTSSKGPFCKSSSKKKLWEGGSRFHLQPSCLFVPLRRYDLLTKRPLPGHYLLATSAFIYLRKHKTQNEWETLMFISYVLLSPPMIASRFTFRFRWNVTFHCSLHPVPLFGFLDSQDSSHIIINQNLMFPDSESHVDSASDLHFRIFVWRYSV